MSLNASNVKAERATLIAELREMCGQEKVVVDDAVILKLLNLCQRSLVHLELPQKAAMQVVTGMIDEAANMLEKAGKTSIVPDMRNVSEFLKQQDGGYA